MNLNVNWVPGITLETMEKAAIIQALKFYRGNKPETARALGISDKTLYNKLEKYEADGKIEEQRYAADKQRRIDIENRMRGIVTNPSTTIFHGAGHIETDPRLRVEPAANPAEEHALPVQERKEVQSVLPAKPSTRSKRRRRERLQRADEQSGSVLPDQG